MSLTVCLSANTIGYPDGGGHLWVYLNWALGLRALGCRVIWLERVKAGASERKIAASIAALRARLEPYGLVECLAVYAGRGEPLPAGAADRCLGLEQAAEADLLLNLRYAVSPEVVGRFRRTALVDIDPGLLQVWMHRGQVVVAPHDVYFTIGETVGRPDGQIPDVGLRWHYTPPCVALDWWPPTPSEPGSPFTTVSHWSADEWMEDEDGIYRNDKRSGFLPFLDLPTRTGQPLELALCIGPDEAEDRALLRGRGWRVRPSGEVSARPWDYQCYIRRSRGEFSCVKPSCWRLRNAWISDRTLCYLASGKPAVVQHTGPSRFLPEAAGLFRFRDLDEAARCLDAAAAGYDRHARLARALAEEYFDARQVVGRVLERALT